MRSDDGFLDILNPGGIAEADKRKQAFHTTSDRDWDSGGGWLAMKKGSVGNRADLNMVCSRHVP